MPNFKGSRSKGQYFRKTFFMFFSIFMVLVVAVSAYLIVNNSNNTEKQIANFENNEIEKTATKINDAFYQAATVCSYLSTIELNDSYVFEPEEDYAGYLVSQSHIDSYTTTFSYINQVYVKDSTGRLYHTSNSPNYFPKIDEKYANLQGKMRNSSIYTVETNNAFENVFISISEGHKHYSKNDVFVSLNTIALAKQILTYTDMRKECIVDENGCILSSYDASKIGKSFFEVYGISDCKIAGITKQTLINNIEHIITLKRVNGTELYAASVTQRSYYSSYFKSGIFSSVLICLMFLVVAIMICMIIIQLSYRPIKDILLQIQQYQDVNIDKNVDEINYINNKLKEMYQSNTLLDETSRQALSKLKGWNVAALQAQICPHFLYNTLDSINWLAYKHLGIENSISLAAQDTAHIMRSSLNISRMFSDVREEIEITKKYIEIVDIRYEKRYKIIWNVDETALDCVIPRLCIQPLIENAVNHAFTGDATDNDEIKISIVDEGSKIYLCVADNGVGMPQESLDEINKNINIEDMGTERNIGLRNINMRCKILYGDEYGLTIESKENVGSKFTITIPKDKHIKKV